MFIDKFFLWMGQPEDVALLAARYVKIVGPGVIIYIWGCAIQQFCSCQGKPRYNLYSTVGASICHWIIAYYLAVKLDMKMTGCAIASSIQFIMRFVIVYICVLWDADLYQCLIPLSHPDSWKDFKYTLKIGWDSFLLRVMGWWAFDVFTQLASMLTETDTAG